VPRAARVERRHDGAKAERTVGAGDDMATIYPFQTGRCTNACYSDESSWSVGVSQTKKAKLEHKINVLGEIAIGIYATVLTSSFWLFLYIIGLRDFAITAAIFLVPFASFFIYRKLRQILNKEPRSLS
jgi:hypothetical protein